MRTKHHSKALPKGIVKPSTAKTRRRCRCPGLGSETVAKIMNNLAMCRIREKEALEKPVNLPKDIVQVLINNGDMTAYAIANELHVSVSAVIDNLRSLLRTMKVVEIPDDQDKDGHVLYSIPDWSVDRQNVLAIMGQHPDYRWWASDFAIYIDGMDFDKARAILEQLVDDGRVLVYDRYGRRPTYQLS